MPVKFYRTLVLAGVLFQAFALTWNAWKNSPTIDEPAHLQAGLELLRNGNFERYAVNPPLVRSIAAVPASLMGLSPVKIEGNHRISDRFEF